MTDFISKHFSTDDFPHGERLARWREEFGRAIVKVDVEPLGSNGPFKAQATLQRLAGIGLARCSGSAARLHRTRSLVAASEEDSIGLIVNLGPAARAIQLGNAVDLLKGDCLLVRTEEPGILDATQHLGILFPRAALEGRLRHLDRLMMRPLLRNAEVWALLLDYLRILQTKLHLEDNALADAVAAHICDLAALAIGSSRDTRHAAGHAVAAARLAKVRTYLDGHFTNPDLTIANVARHHGISSRYLQKLLEQSGTSFTAHLNELRLSRALVLLTEEAGLPRRVGDIALSVGFSDISHFNRLFRARFGDTPTGVRRI